MGTVIFSMGVSLDGFIADADGEIDWTAPDDELFRFHIDQTRELSAHLCGRRLYETMLVWETAPETRWDPPELEFARIWQALPKVVFSSTLERVEGNARLATDDAATELAKLKEGGDVAVGGAGLAATLVELDLIDEYRLFVYPVVLGGGTPYFPARAERLDLELVETRTFGSRVVYLRHRRTGSGR
ncbi:MAG TPA: dihydrofolate reductase family protein [Actinomycetes bacterium]|nr:dihydrofolate reductase family protein [Actinomycetes bacterium]